MSEVSQLKLAQRGAYLSLIVYIVSAIVKYTVGYVYHSAAVRADGLNNMTDIIVSVAVIVGLKISIKPADRNHPYGHLKSENIASLLVAFIIMYVGLEVIISNAPRILNKTYEQPNILTLYVSLASGIVIIAVYFVNHKLAQRTKSSSLKSAAKDNLSDGLVSIGTAVGLIFTQIGFPIMDVIIAMILGVIILYTGFTIFREAVFTLSDGFNEQALEAYKADILEVADVMHVASIKGRYHGSSIFVDVTIVVDEHLSLKEAHDICDDVEVHLHNKGISSVYVHPEPYESAVHEINK